MAGRVSKIAKLVVGKNADTDTNVRVSKIAKLVVGKNLDTDINVRVSKFVILLVGTSGINPGDSITFSDSYGVSSPYEQQFSDSIGFSDELTYEYLILFVRYDKSFEDSIEFNDSVGYDFVGGVFGKYASDSLSNLDDSFLYNFGLNISDTLSFSDAVALRSGGGRSAFDTLQYNWLDKSNVQEYVYIYVLGTDDISYSDFLNVINFIAKSAGDSVLISDVLNVDFKHKPITSDQLSIDDASTVVFSLNLSVSDSFSLGDSVGTGTPQPSEFTFDDQITFSDSVDKEMFGSEIAYIRRYLNDVI